MRDDIKPLLPKQIFQGEYQPTGVVRNLGILFDSEFH